MATTKILNSNNAKFIQAIVSQWERLFIKLHIELYSSDYSRIYGPCPIHQGNNHRAFNMYTDSGAWQCFTNGCHLSFGGSIIGFVRGMLAKHFGWTIGDPIPDNTQDALDYLLEFAEMSTKDLQTTQEEIDKYHFITQASQFYNRTEDIEPLMQRRDVQRWLTIPAPYYVGRNYSAEVLTKYDVGTCTDPIHEMYNRVVVPVYNDTHRYLIGCTGRTLTDDARKWKHSTGFKAGNYLYNLWYAKEHIDKTGVAILVESPGNVWRLEEAGLHTGLAIFGTHLTSRQFAILSSTRARSLVIVMDNDDAGRAAHLSISQQCNKIYRIYSPTLNQNDLGDMSIDAVTKDIKPYLQQIQQQCLEGNYD